MRSLVLSAIIFLTSAAPVALAAPVAPATRATPAAPPTSQPLAQDVLPQAVHFMQQGRYERARPLIDKLYSLAAPEDLPRPVLLNHAILDLAQPRTLAIRALKDLHVYLVKHREPDEFATDLFGSALDVVVTSNPPAKQSPVWQTAFREWDRRNFLLDHARPGMRRWGPRWLSDDELQRVLVEADEYEEKLRSQKYRVTLARWQAGLPVASGAAPARTAARTPTPPTLPTRTPAAGAGAASPSRKPPPTPPGVTADEGLVIDPSATPPGMSVADAEVLADFMLNQHDLATEMRALRELEAARPRPQWPRHFDPVDSSEVKPPAPAWALSSTTAPAAVTSTTAPAERSLPPPFVEP